MKIIQFIILILMCSCIATEIKIKSLNITSDSDIPPVAPPFISTGAFTEQGLKFLAINPDDNASI